MLFETLTTCNCILYIDIHCDTLLWSPQHGSTFIGRPPRTYIDQLCDDIGCLPEDLPNAMSDRDAWRDRVKDIRASTT